MITAKQVAEEISYDPEDGAFTRLKSGGGVGDGSHAGGLDHYGHRTISILGKRYRAARIAWVLQTGSWPENGLDVDHIDGDRSNDKWKNLRLATRVQNCANMKAKGRSGLKGATWVSSKGKWKSQIRTGGKNRHLGYFGTAAEANEAYKKAAVKEHGEFARW